MKGDAVRAELSELVDRIDASENRSRRVPEQVPCLPADRPQTKAEFVIFTGLRCHGLSQVVGVCVTTAGVSPPSRRGSCWFLR